MRRVQNCTNVQCAAAVQRRYYRHFDLPVEIGHRRTHTYFSVPINHSTRWGGRSAFFRQATTGRYSGPDWKRFRPTLQYNIDIWCAQQTLRKKWKARDWDVYEMPYEKAPQELQRVIPELYTELPLFCGPRHGDFSNLRRKVFDMEELHSDLFSSTVSGKMQPLKKVDKGKMTLDKFLNCS